MNEKTKKIIILLGVVVFAIITFNTALKSTNFIPSGPDAKLYYGLAENLVNGRGFFDDIRNDEILPSVGHPLILSFFVKFGIEEGLTARIIYILSLMVFVVMGRLVTKSYYPGIALVFVFLQLNHPTFIIGGVELSLLFSSLLLWLSLTAVYIHRNDRKLLKWLYILSLSLFAFTLVRPIFLPVFYLLSPIVVVVFFKRRVLKKYMGPLFVLFSMLTVVISYSHFRYKDSRLMTGTYSAIPLYSAFNNDIKLDEIYFSYRWKQYIKPSQYKIKTQVLKNVNGWRERDKLLKKEVLAFVLEHPQKAFNGFKWRLSKYTWDSDWFSYKIIFYVWLGCLLGVLLLCFRRRKEYFWGLLFNLLPLYVILIQSMFPYVGPRYYLSAMVFIASSLILNFYLFFGLRTKV